MAYNFTKAFPTYGYKAGSLFLGHDDQVNEIGVETEVNAITIGGAGSGKGAALLIPNMLRWPHALVAIDPKGENAAQTWRQRQDMGQLVGVLDPFHVAKGTESVRVSINPLQGINEEDRRARAKILSIANGLIVVHDPRHMEWTQGARSMWAGAIAFNAVSAPPEYRTFKALRAFFMQPNETLYTDAQLMAQDERFGGLIRATGVAIMTAIETEKSMEQSFLGLARRSTEWLDDPAISEALSSTSFDLDALKTGRASLYLVLPADDVSAYAGFLRLFIKSALRVMGEQSTLPHEQKNECLFLLDEFYSLGKLEEATEAAGRMRGYGVHLWPFIQNLGQIFELYGPQGAEAFFTNADAHIFLGNDKDPPALKHISERLGMLTPAEIATALPAPAVTHQRNPHEEGIFGGYKGKRLFESEAAYLGRIRTEDENRTRQARAADDGKANEYNHAMKMAGRPRMSQEEIAALVGKGVGDKLARSIIVFTKAGDVLNIKPAPYFKKATKKAGNRSSVPAVGGSPVLPEIPQFLRGWRGWLAVGGILATICTAATVPDAETLKKALIQVALWPLLIAFLLGCLWFTLDLFRSPKRRD